MPWERDNIVHTWEHRGMTISLVQSGDFKVGEDDGRRYFASLHLAKAEVDDQVAAEAKARHTDLAMPVIDEHGNRHVIRGLNRGSGKVLGVPDRVDTIYYPTPTIEAMVKEHADLSAQAATLWARLRRVAMPDRIGSGRITAEEYDDRIQRLEEKYAAAMKAAHDLDDVPVVTGPAEGG